MSKKSDKIEKPWCVRKSVIGSLIGWGKIEEEYNSEEHSTLEIQYSEGQMYSNQLWDSKYVDRFNTLEEAVEHFIEHKPGVDIRERDSTPDELRERARRDFPSYFKKKR